MWRHPLFKMIIAEGVFLTTTYINAAFRLTTLPDSENIVVYQINIFTVSSVFAGFSFTVLGLLLGLSSEELVRQLKNTSIMLRKSKRITTCVLLFCISCFVSLLGTFFSQSKFIRECLFLSAIGYLLMGMIYFVLSVKDVYGLIEKIYKYNKDENRISKEEFEETIQQAKSRLDNNGAGDDD